MLLSLSALTSTQKVSWNDVISLITYEYKS